MKNAIQEIEHTNECPTHTAVAQMINIEAGLRYRAKCRNCGGTSPEYTKRQWDKKWPKGIGTEWPKVERPRLFFDGVDFVEEKLP